MLLVGRIRPAIVAVRPPKLVRLLTLHEWVLVIPVDDGLEAAGQLLGVEVVDARRAVRTLFLLKLGQRRGHLRPLYVLKAAPDLFEVEKIRPLFNGQIARLLLGLREEALVENDDAGLGRLRLAWRDLSDLLSPVVSLPFGRLLVTIDALASQVLGVLAYQRRANLISKPIRHYFSHFFLQRRIFHACDVP